MADGSVKIDVKLEIKNAEAQAKALSTALKDVDIKQSAIKNTDQLNEALKKTKSQSNQTENALKSTNETLKATSTAYKQLESIQRAAGLETSANVSKLNAYRAELARVRSQLSQNKQEQEKLSKNYSANGQKINELKADYQRLTAEERINATEVSSLQRKYGALSPQMAATIDKTKQLGISMQNAGSKMSAIGTKATLGFTVPVVTALGAATKASVDFNAEMAKIKPLLNDGTVSAAKLDAQIKNLGDHSKTWSAQYGIATSEINEGMETLIKRGYTYNQTLGAMPSILQAAKASGDDFNTVMSVSTSTLEQFGMKSNNTATMLKNTQKVTDSLSYVANKTSSGFSDLGLAMSYVGPTAHSMGMSLESTTAILGQMSQQGIEGEKAGTGLRTILSSLTNPIGQNVAGMKALGISTEDYKKGLIDLPDVIDIIKKNTVDKTDAEKAALLQQAFGIEGQNAMNILVNEGSQGIRDLTQAQKEATGYTKSQAQQQMQSSKAHMDQLKAAAHTLAIEFGDKLLPEITDLVKGATGLVNWFSKLDDGQQKLIIKSALVVAAGGPMLSLFGKLTGGVGTLVKTGASLTTWLLKVRKGTDLAKESMDAVNTGKTVSKLGAVKTAASGILRPLAMIGPASIAADAGLGTLALGALPVIAAIGAVGTATYFAIKAAKEHEAEIKEQKKSYDEYGTVISSSSQKSIKSFNDLHQSAVNDMALLDTSVGEQSKKLSSDVADKYGKMADIIVGKINDASNKGKAAISSIGASYGEAGATWATALNTNMNEGNKGVIKKVTEAKKTISDLLASVGGDFSQLNSQQQAELQQAQNTIDEQTSAFGMAYKDQLALQKSYEDQHGQITEKMYKKDVKDMNNLHSETEKAADKHYDKQKKALDKAYEDHTISKEQHDSSIKILDDKRNADQAKSDITYATTAQALVKNYKNTGQEMLKTKETLNTARVKYDENGTKEYWDSVNEEWVTQKQWIANAKKSNEDYLKDQVTKYGSIKKNLKDYQKAQKAAYKEMGMDEQTATIQSKLDKEELYEETTKAGEKLAKAGKANHDSYIKGLQDGTMGTPESVASKWGLDLSDTTSKINLGKYGEKTAQEFWDDFNSGSEEGAGEAKVYFANILSDFKEVGTNKIKDISTDSKTELREGLKSGVLSLKDLSGTFGKTIIDLFPKNLKDVSDSEMVSLRQGLTDGTVSMKDLKERFGKNIYDIFPNDLSQLGKDDISSLEAGLKSKDISKAELKKKYGDQFDDIFKKDLGSLGKEDVSTLNLGLKLGVIDKDELKEKYGSQFDDIFKKDLKSLGKDDISTLNMGLKLGVIDKDELKQKYGNDLESIYGKSLTDLGKNDIKTLAEGIKLGIPGVQEQMDGLAKMVGDKATINVKDQGNFTMATLLSAYQNGKLTTKQFMTGFQGLIHQGLSVDGFPHGQGAMQSYNNGLSVFAQDPLNTSAKTGQGVESNFNVGIDASNNLSNQLGGKKSGTKSSGSFKFTMPFKNGSKGELLQDTPSIVGDGGQPELIDYGNGQMELSPDKPTFRYLNAGAQVFSGPDTKRVAPLLKSMGMPMFANGTGGKIGDWIKNLFGDAFKFMESPVANWGKLVDNSYDMNPFNGNAGSEIGTSGKAFEKKQTDWLKKLELAANPVGAGVERWRPYVQRALAMLGLSTSDGMIAKVLRQIGTESGGNPNAQGGTDGLKDGAAFGLMQVKPNTFSSNAYPGHNNPANGFDSILAGLRYAMKRYGSDLSFLGKGHGYDKGGISTEPEIAAVSEHGQTELHIPDDQSDMSKYLTEMAVKMSFGDKAFISTTAEEASGFRSAPSISGSSVFNSAGNQSGSNADISGDVHITFMADTKEIASLLFPKNQILQNHDMTVAFARGGVNIDRTI